MDATTTFRSEVTRILCNDRFKDSETTKEVEQIVATARRLFVEPAKPEAARWWEIGERMPAGIFYALEGSSALKIFVFRFPTQAITRWHGPHPTEQAAREHYEATKAPAPQPTAEYDAGWTWPFYSSQFPGFGAPVTDPRHNVTYPMSVAAVAAEAARRERETWAEERDGLMTTIQSLKDELNDKNPSTQKLASAYDQAMRTIADLESRIVRQGQVIVACGAKALARPPEGGYSLAIENNYSVQCVSILRADRDRLAAELAALKATPAPTPELAGIVERAHRHVSTTCQYFYSKHDGLDALRRELAQLVSDIDEALAAGGGR